MTRVQIPAYTDRWMMGDRFGEIVKVRPYRPALKHVYPGVRAMLLTSAQYNGDNIEIAHVRLDKSGKTVRVVLADCEVV